MLYKSSKKGAMYKKIMFLFDLNQATEKEMILKCICYKINFSLKLNNELFVVELSLDL